MLSKITSGLIRILCLIFIVGIIGTASLGFITDGKKFAILMIIGFAVFLGLFLLAAEKLSDFKHKWFWLCLIGLGLILRVAYAFTTNVEVLSDQLTCLDAAQMVAKGDYSWAETDPYFVRWAYQIPFVLYEGLILKLFGTIRALYVCNGIFSILTCLLIYLIAKEMFGSKTALITTAVFSCFPVFIFSISRLYNQIISGVFLLLAIYFFVKICKGSMFEEPRKGFLKVLLFSAVTGLFLGISNLFRTEAIIAVLAVECWFIYYFIINAKKKMIGVMILRSLLCMAAVYACYKLVSVSTDAAVKLSGVSQYGIRNGCVYWFIVCGLDRETYGAYSRNYKYIVLEEPAQQRETFKKILKEFFGAGIPNLAKFFALKEAKMWGQFNECTAFNESWNVPKGVVLAFDAVNHGFYLLVTLLAAFSLRKKRFESATAFLFIMFLGFSLSFMIKEISPRYRYTTIMLLMLLAANTIDYLSEKKPITSKISSWRGNHG